MSEKPFYLPGVGDSLRRTVGRNAAVRLAVLEGRSIHDLREDGEGDSEGVEVEGSSGNDNGSVGNELNATESVAGGSSGLGDTAG